MLRVRSARPFFTQKAPCLYTRALATVSQPSKKQEGDISSGFASLSGSEAPPLPQRFVEIKRQLIGGHEEAVVQSFHSLLRTLAQEIPIVKALGSSIIPSISYSSIDKPPASFTEAHKKTGVAVIRSVVPEAQALGWLDDLKSYIATNPTTKGFPASAPAVYELYWSRAQLLARSDPACLRTSRFLMSHWHCSSPTSLISTAHPMSYADRVRIRPPGDTSFALGPHCDGGSCERWEPNGYGLGGTYNDIFRGNWESYDPFDASTRLPVISDLYNAAGFCSAFRMYQGWLSLSRTGPGEGTLRVNPLFSRATAYYLLRPCFSPKNPDPTSASFLSADNWTLEPEPSSILQGSYPGQAQEFSAVLHPHLELQSTMVSVPEVRPGDYIAWHCDSIHAVDSVHKGQEHASVLYIPVCPLTELNARYLAKQKESFLAGMYWDYSQPVFPKLRYGSNTKFFSRFIQHLIYSKFHLFKIPSLQNSISLKFHFFKVLSLESSISS